MRAPKGWRGQRTGEVIDGMPVYADLRRQSAWCWVIFHGRPLCARVRFNDTNSSTAVRRATARLRERVREAQHRMATGREWW